MEFPSELVRLVDTREFQRLRGVRQLGTASFVYPGAVHTRFDHSLGTCWLASRLLDLLGIELDHKERLAVLAWALLHDVTHVPFGHTLEDERRIFERHDTPARVRKALPQGELGAALVGLDLLEPLLRIALGSERWEHQITAGAVAADLLDYLARDAFFCGLSQRYDPRIFGLFGIEGQGDSARLFLDAQRDGVLRQDALSEIIHLLRLRYFLSERVYFHHTKTVSGAMISRAVEEAVGQGLTLDEIAALTDEGLWTLLESRFGDLPTVGELMAALRSRRLYKRVFLLTAELPEERRSHFVQLYHYDSQRRAQAEAALAKACKLRPEHLILYCPALKMQLKEGKLPVKVDAGPSRSLDELPVDEIGILKERHRLLWRFYVFLSPDKMAKAEAVAKACEVHFGEANHLPRFRSGQLFLGV
jgi:HD superfamily phosphohydrolase